ncbi:MAG: helix-turn-helix domain-containing protein [Actinobacteria bacterium]|nr:helix-turn-helix domain-containing protein [Actinomycetota bacterium]
MEKKEKAKSEEREEISDIGILDIVDLSVLLRVSVQTARRYINEKRIPAYRVVPGKYLISVKQLEKYIEENTSK